MLKQLLAGCDSLLVAYSGGVDSSFLLKVASGTIPDNLVALTIISPTNPDQDIAMARRLTRELGVRHIEVAANELEIAGYAENPPNRCYFCKRNLYTICQEQAQTLGIGSIADGVNVDDLGDYRPGLDAARQAGVRHLLVESGLSKDEIRLLSRREGLPTWDRPASPCLSSRFPYGTEITEERLLMVARGEELLRSHGFPEVRVRYHQGSARIELPQADFARLLDSALRTRLVCELKELGFHFVSLDLEGFRSGSLNRLLTPSL